MKDSQKYILDSDNVGLLLMKLSLPAFLGIFVMTLYNVVDTIFIGRYVGHLGIAGLSIVFPLQMLAMGIGQMIGMGGASIISRLLGEDDNSRAEKALGNALITGVAASSLLIIAGSVDIDFWLAALGASQHILPYARDYMVFILPGLFFQIIAMSTNNLIRAEGNTQVPMKAMCWAAVLNIVLDAVFIIPLDMGIRGAALATLIAQIISVAYQANYFLSGHSYLKFHIRNLIIDINLLSEIFSIGIASFARTLTSSVSAVFVNHLLILHGGDMAVSVFGIINRLMMFAMMPGHAIGQGLQPILGYNYGAKRFGNAVRAVSFAMVAGTASCLVFFVVLMVFPDRITHIFTTNEEILMTSVHAVRIVFLALPMMGFIMVGSLVFQSIGKPVQSFITSISRSVLFLIPLMCILPRFMAIEGVWLAFPLADNMTALLTFILLAPVMQSFRESKIPPKQILNKQTYKQLDFQE